MAVNKHATGGFRAYKKILGTEHQFYFADKSEADAMQSTLEAKSDLAHSLSSPTLFSRSGRLIGLRVRKYKRTNKPTFQLQVTVNGKQKKTELLFQKSFEPLWTVFFKLWREHFHLSVVDTIDYKDEILKAKKLYMQDLYQIENSSQE